jgi:hypothetical protein
VREEHDAATGVWFCPLRTPWICLALCVGLTSLYLLSPCTPVYLTGSK